MFSTKKNVQRVVASLQAYGIKHIVISPGSRNASLIQTFTQHTYFEHYTIVDERSAAFFALGMAQKLQRPVAICCTSGSAVLNYAPAIAEAFYQQIPLIVLSADRSSAWIGQMDGQTLPQPNVFGHLVGKSVQLPEINNKEEDWYCQRLIHECLIACTHKKTPVHLNIPISEPLFDFSTTELPVINPIEYFDFPDAHNLEQLAQNWSKAKKKMIIVGQMPKDKSLKFLLEQLAKKTDCVFVAEHLSNIVSPIIIGNFDLFLGEMTEDERVSFAPDLVLTFGGHIVSKRLKHFLRKYKPNEHWHLNNSGELIDLYQSLTHLIKMDTHSFLTNLIEKAKPTSDFSFSASWQLNAKKRVPPTNILFSDLSVIESFMHAIPNNVALHLANSSTVRNAQLFSLDETIEVFCNRGTNGIDGTLSTASGFAALHDKRTFLVIGDLSFFYDLNAIWNQQLNEKLRILLINNGGGEIFQKLPSLKDSEAISIISAQHQIRAKDWALAADLIYLSASNEDELNENMHTFATEMTSKAMLFEIIINTKQ